MPPVAQSRGDLGAVENYPGNNLGEGANSSFRMAECARKCFQYEHVGVVETIISFRDSDLWIKLPKLVWFTKVSV